ncbi:hypothetical protein F7734_48650 [Scytonema sp. UIC 10036]|uniref:hypothetical protein n=1 Tax=Scytonema sp. UIC 10036 TaxID=2304196 RepID=UPI0012DA84FC|nr:hypothetical protein [Scytonema sp. UIC 10036]MUG99741.1 hypothetical protein [Scytonema sp. UIC 10036]
MANLYLFTRLLCDFEEQQVASFRAKRDRQKQCCVRYRNMAFQCFLKNQNFCKSFKFCIAI